MVDPRHIVLIAEGRFYEDIADQMANGAMAVFTDAGIHVERVAVPGAFEIPAAIRMAIRSMELHSSSVTYAGFVALGCVIRGETDHYDHICRETARALMDISVDYSVAIGFGVLTCETYEQAMERAAVNRKNKGADAARACIRMMEIQRILRLAQR